MGIERSYKKEGTGSTATAPYGHGYTHALTRPEYATSRAEARPEVRGGRPSHILIG